MIESNPSHEPPQSVQGFEMEYHAYERYHRSKADYRQMMDGGNGGFHGAATPPAYKTHNGHGGKLH